jgi:hypothetical protein
MSAINFHSRSCESVSSQCQPDPIGRFCQLSLQFPPSSTKIVRLIQGLCVAVAVRFGLSQPPSVEKPATSAGISTDVSNGERRLQSFRLRLDS